MNILTHYFPMFFLFLQEDVSDECEPERMKRLNNPFTHYTERGAMFKMQRLSRIKSIAAAMKQSARDRIKVRNNKRAGEGYARLSTRTPENENDDDENGVEEGVYSVVAPSGEDIRRFSKGLKKLESKHNANNGENEERKTEDTIKTPLLQQKKKYGGPQFGISVGTTISTIIGTILEFEKHEKTY